MGTSRTRTGGPLGRLLAVLLKAALPTAVLLSSVGCVGPWKRSDRYVSQPAPPVRGAGYDNVNGATGTNGPAAIESRRVAAGPAGKAVRGSAFDPLAQDVAEGVGRTVADTAAVVEPVRRPPRDPYNLQRPPWSADAAPPIHTAGSDGDGRDGGLARSAGGASARDDAAGRPDRREAAGSKFAIPEPPRLVARADARTVSGRDAGAAAGSTLPGDDVRQVVLRTRRRPPAEDLPVKPAAAAERPGDRNRAGAAGGGTAQVLAAKLPAPGPVALAPPPVDAAVAVPMAVPRRVPEWVADGADPSAQRPQADDPHARVFDDFPRPGERLRAAYGTTAAEEIPEEIDGADVATADSLPHEPTAAAEEASAAGNADDAGDADRMEIVSRYGTRRPPAETDLRVQRPTFCKQVYGFGEYDPVERNVALPGQELLLYAELEGYRSVEKDGVWQTALDNYLTVRDGRGELVDAVAFGEVVDRCRSPRQDFFCHYTFALPEDLPPGDYTVELVVRDVSAAGQARQAVPLKVVSPGQMARLEVPTGSGEPPAAAQEPPRWFR